MKTLDEFLNSLDANDGFNASISSRGGYITFSNSGRGGERKYFQIGLDSIIQSLKDIKENINVFTPIQEYEEKKWRDVVIYFSDPVASALFASQTKPLFSVLSKTIQWASPELNQLNTGKEIHISESSVTNAISALDALANSFISSDSNKRPKAQKSKHPLQQIFYGAPGTGKSFTIDDMADDDHSVRTTFHPDSDYASFVGAYKPTMAPMPINAFVGTTVHHAKNAENEKAYENKIVYKYVPQAFLKAYVAAWKDLDNDYYLVIEEINRGNCAQIFGDLFQLLDRNSVGSSSYAIHADDDIRQFLSTDENGFADLTEEQAQAIRDFVLEKDNGKTRRVGQDILDGKLLLLPPRLHIWATMNTSDQSLFPIDSAFKRRWDWKYIPIDYKPTDRKTGQPIDWKFRIGDNLYSWGQFLGKINPEIYTLTESSDKQMGYFFAKADRSTGIISEDVFLNKVLFYLWTDVFKDFDVSSEYFHNKKENRSFRFTDFFEDPEALENFIANFQLDAEENIDIVETEVNEDFDGMEHSLVIKWPDGHIISLPSKTETYLRALKRIGIERAAEGLEGRYRLKDVPVISKTKSPKVEGSNYKYDQIGDWFVLVGIDNHGSNLRLLSEKYDLGLEVDGE